MPWDPWEDSTEPLGLLWLKEESDHDIIHDLSFVFSGCHSRLVDRGGEGQGAGRPNFTGVVLGFIDAEVRN